MSLVALDSVSRVLSSALDGVSLRQHVIADNIANVDTPGFRATSVEFEGALRSAIEDGSFDKASGAPMKASTQATDTPVGANGNNVDLRKETVAAVQSQFQYQLLSRAVNDHYQIIRDSLGGS